MTGDNIDAEKRALRASCLDRRKGLMKSARPHDFDVASYHFLEHVPVAEEIVVSAYYPINSEFDPRPILRRLDHERRVCALPVVTAAHRPLRFRRWHPEDPVEEGAHGTYAPLAGAPIVEPSVVIVPMLAFDRAGYRLGYGGGYFDRTLEQLRRKSPGTLAVGLAFAGQELDVVPHGDHDQPLDWIVTEKEAIFVGAPT